jgi:hypothetical protein
MTQVSIGREHADGFAPSAESSRGVFELRKSRLECEEIERNLLSERNCNACKFA